MSREDFEGIREHAKQVHKERVAKNPERIDYAIRQFEKHGIEYELKNAEIGHFHCWRKKDDELFQFWASTGKILNHSKRGIHFLIKLLTSGEKKTPIEDVFKMIFANLPNEPAKPGHFWSPESGEILIDNEVRAEAVADFIEDLVGGQIVTTGYYDPEEDERNGETDQYTGYYYVSID